MPSFRLVLRHPTYGMYTHTVPVWDIVKEFDSIELIEEGTERIIALIEHGQYVDLGSKIDRLLGYLDAIAEELRER